MHFTHILLSASVYKHEKLNHVTFLEVCSNSGEKIIWFPVLETSLR